RNYGAERHPIGVLKSPLQHGFRNLEANKIMVAVGGITILRDLGHVEAKLNSNVVFGIVLVGDLFAEFLAELGKLDAHRLIDRGMSAVVRRVMSQRAEGESIFVEVGGFLEQVHD